jgi:hypothetical protein
MAELRILLYPYFEELKMSITYSQSNELIKLCYECNLGWETIRLEECTELGYMGMDLDLGNSEKIYIYDEKIFYSKNNITQLLIDSEKKVTDLALKIVMKKYYKELNYFFEVKRYDKLNKRKKKYRNKRIERALKELEEEERDFRRD